MKTLGFAALSSVVMLGVCSCHSSRHTPEDASSDAGGGGAEVASNDDFATVKVGFKFRRSCASRPDGVELPITGVTCTILGDAGRVRANLTTTGAPLLAVTFDGLEPGRATTLDPGMTDVILQGTCPGRARGSSQPCTVELAELKRAATTASSGQVEPGSALTLRVTCPPSLDNDTGDAVGTTQQTPLRFEVSAQDCAAY